jgi:hypothetical protein
MTPGIEYFVAASDDEAEAFAEGRAVVTPRLVRGDGVAPDGLFAVLGALLTGRAIDVLASDPELTVITVDEREDGVVRLVRLPEVVSDALSIASDARLLEVGHRARVIGELRAAEPELIAEFLRDLASLTRPGGRLYARTIEGLDPTPEMNAKWRRMTAALPWIGVATAVVVVVGGILLTREVSHPLRLAFLPVAGLVLSFSLGVIIRRRSSRRLLSVVESASPASIGVTIDANGAFLGRLPSIVADVVGDVEIPTSVPRGRLHLVAHPGGLDLVFGDDRVIAFPAERVLGIDAAAVQVTRGPHDTDGVVGGFVIVLSVNDDESVVWEVAAYDSIGGRLTPAQLAPIAEAWALLTGARWGGSLD